MKKIILLIVGGCFLAASPVAARNKYKEYNRVYLRAGLGYAIAGAADGISYSSSSTQQEIKKQSYGAGGKATIGLGYRFNRNLAFQCDFLWGFVPAKNGGTIFNSSSSSSTTFSIKAKNPFFAIPAIVINTDTKPFDVYARAGVVVPLVSKTLTQYSGRSSSGGLVVEEYTDSYEFGVGYQGAVGVKWAAGKTVGLWLEVNYMNLCRWARSSELTKLTYNDQDKLSGLYPSDVYTKYKSEYTIPTGTKNLYEPTVAPTYSISYSNVGVALGISIALN